MTGFSSLPELAGYVAAFRYALVLLAIAWACAALRASRGTVLLCGLLFVEAALAFWILILGRPYGLLIDAAATQRLAEAAVASSSGSVAGSFLAGEPAAFPAWAGLAKAGVPVDLLRRLPSVLPAVVVPAIGVLIFWLWGRRADALAAACLWLAFAPGALESTRGLGLVPGQWARPEAGLLLLVLAALGLSSGRLPPSLAALVCALSAIAPVALAPRSPLLPSTPTDGLALGDALLALTLDQAPWLALAAIGLRQVKDPVSLGFLAGGALGVLAGALGRGDAWASFGFYKLGLLLAAAAASGVWLATLGSWAQRAFPGGARLWRDPSPERIGLAVVIALFVPGSFLTWWDPMRTDPVARESAGPLSPAMEPPLAFIARETPKDAVFLASADYAPAVAALAGRRVLRAPSLLLTADDARRQRAEGAILAGREIPPGGDDHGVRFVLLAPGDFRARGINRPEDLEGRPGFRLRYADPAGYRVYEVVR